MNSRMAFVLLLVPLLASAARAEAGSIPDVRVSPGAGIGLITLSVELNVEGRRWYGGGQLALAAATRSAGFAGYSGIRVGAFLTDGPTAPFLGVGLGALGEGDFDAGTTHGWGASAEAGIALRRDERWFHPQIVLQGILPFAQRVSSTYPYQPGAVFLVGVRIFL